VPAVWGGDPEATFDETQGLPAMLRGGLNLGMSGVPVWGSDISGFKCITDYPYDKEIYLRWVEVGAVSPMMEEENACSNPLGSRTKWKLWNDQETIDVYRSMALLHTRLAPYFEVLAREANATGTPIMRHPFLLHPHEAESWAVESAFYLGPSLFTAPIVERGSTVKDTWLPPGKFVDLTDLVEYEGGKHVSIPAPLGKLPLLLRDGGIVPMLDPSIDTLVPATEPGIVTPEQVKDVLDVVVALGPNGEAHFTMADGTQLSAKRGSGAPGRIQVESTLDAATTITQDDLVLDAKGPLPRRIRWDVHRLQ
jgi:alpha-D-xyloside xylohydrolase